MRRLGRGNRNPEVIVRAGTGRRRFLRQRARVDRGELKTDRNRCRSGEKRTPCGKR